MNTVVFWLIEKSPSSRRGSLLIIYLLKDNIKQLCVSYREIRWNERLFAVFNASSELLGLQSIVLPYRYPSQGFLPVLCDGIAQLTWLIILNIIADRALRSLNRHGKSYKKQGRHCWPDTNYYLPPLSKKGTGLPIPLRLILRRDFVLYDCSVPDCIGNG